MSETKNNIAKGDTVVNIERLMSLERTVNEKDQLIGAYKQQVDSVKAQLNKAALDHSTQIAKLNGEFAEKEDRLEKEVKIIKSSNASELVCRHCDTRNNLHHSTCSWCGKRLNSATVSNADVSYKNLDSVIEDIREKEAKKLKLDFHTLEQNIEDLKLDKDKLYKENGRFKLQKDQFQKECDQAIIDAKSDIRKRHQKEVANMQSTIDGLEEKIEQLENDKTDEIIEANRKQEIIDMKLRIEELESELSAVEEAAQSKRGFKAWAAKRRKERLEKEAILEREDKKQRVNSISNNYPSQKSFWDFITTGDVTVDNPFKKVFNWFNARWA